MRILMQVVWIEIFTSIQQAVTLSENYLQELQKMKKLKKAGAGRPKKIWKF
jgi:hypothetical protein